MIPFCLLKLQRELYQL